MTLHGRAKVPSIKKSRSALEEPKVAPKIDVSNTIYLVSTWAPLFLGTYFIKYGVTFETNHDVFRLQIWTSSASE